MFEVNLFYPEFMQWTRSTLNSEWSIISFRGNRRQMLQLAADSIIDHGCKEAQAGHVLH